jgi:hypothetical protein
LIITVKSFFTEGVEKKKNKKKSDHSLRSLEEIILPVPPCRSAGGKGNNLGETWGGGPRDAFLCCFDICNLNRKGFCLINFGYSLINLSGFFIKKMPPYPMECFLPYK